MNKNQEAMQKLFEGIYNFVAPAPDPCDRVEQKSFYTQLRAGIDISGFTKKEYALMADDIPAVQRDYAATAKVSDVYQKILGAVVPEDRPSEERQKEYENAKSLVSKDSEDYADYKDARKNYQKAYIAYCRLLNDKNADPYDVEEAKMDMQNAFEDFEAANKTEIEDALSLIATYEHYTPSSIFNNAGLVFEQEKTKNNTTGYYDIDLIPNLEKGPDKLAWEKTVIHTSSQEITLGTEASATDFSSLDEISGGWWFWKYKNQASAEEQKLLQSANSNMKTNDMSLSMEVAVAEINRPWFNEALLTYSEAYLRNEDAGVICGGKLTGGGVMPIVPTAFVFVRNVKIYNQFSEEEKQMLHTITDKNAQNLSYGPFSVTHVDKMSFHDDISTEEQTKFGNVSCLDLGSQPQLIGIISTVMTPKFPMKSGMLQMGNRKIINLRENPITSSKKMWSAMKSILYADELAHMMNTLRVNSFKEFSDAWVTTLESRIEKLNTVGGDWHGVRDEIAANFLSPFVTYSNLYSSINEKLIQREEIGSEDIVTMIEELYELAQTNAKAIRSNKLKFDEWIASVNNLLVLLHDSMREGWQALDVDETSVTALAEKLALLQNALEESLNDIMPSYLSQSEDFAKSYGELVYSVLIGGEEISYLSVAGLFISVGSIFYEALSSHMDVVSYSERLAECKKEFSLKQQALAQTKSLIQFLQTLLLEVSAMRNEFDGIIDIWDSEKAFLKGLLNAYRTGADPKRTVLVAEDAKWKTNSQYAEKFLAADAKTYQFEIKL